MAPVDVGHAGTGHPNGVAAALPHLEREFKVLATPHPQAWKEKRDQFVSRIANVKEMSLSARLVFHDGIFEVVELDNTYTSRNPIITELLNTLTRVVPPELLEPLPVDGEEPAGVRGRLVRLRVVLTGLLLPFGYSVFLKNHIRLNNLST